MPAPIWHLKAETARAVRQRIRAVLEWAIAMELQADNQCDRVLPELGSQHDIVRHMRALPHRDVVTAVETVRASSSAPAVKLGFKFLVVTAARSGEVRQATWGELDRDGLVWTISPTRMKAKREHRVPLSRRAAHVLDAARPLGNGGAFIFPSLRGKPISAMTLPKTLQNHPIAAAAHGFRCSSGPGGRGRTMRAGGLRRRLWLPVYYDRRHRP